MSATPGIHLKIVATNRARCGAGPQRPSRLTQDSRTATCEGCLEMVTDPPVREPWPVPEGQEPLFDLEMIA